MVGGIHIHLDDLLASQYQLIDWTQHTTCPINISIGGTFWFLEPCMRKLHTRPTLTSTVVSTVIRSDQQALGSHTNE